MKGLVSRKSDRWCAVVYEGLDPVTGKERRRWHPGWNHLGGRVGVTANCDLTINGLTNQALFEIEAELDDGMILVTAPTEIEFADYQVTAPTAPLVLSVEDHGIVEVQLWMSR